MMREPQALPASRHTTGGWTVHISGRDHTFLRGVPVQIESMSDTDPFGPGVAQLRFPQITPLERVGVPGSELQSLRAWAPITITWTTTDPDSLRGLRAMRWPTTYSWRGYMTGFDWTSGGDRSLAVTCIGGVRALDNLTAQPRTLRRPISYEAALTLVTNGAISRSGLPRMRPMVPFNWQNIPGWNRRYDPKMYKDWPKYLRPLGLTNGQFWSGLLTREMGQWDPVLSSYVAGLLSMMYTPGGRVSMRMKHGAWQPELYYVPMFQYADDSRLLRVNAAWPGLSFELSEDYTQVVNAVYGEVSSTFSGITFTNEQFSWDGRSSYYLPFAESMWSQRRRQAATLPRDVQQELARFPAAGVRREQHVVFQDGLQPFEAKQLARDHVHRNGEPGMTGTITLSGVDPQVFDTVIDGQAGGEKVPFPKQMITAGMSIQVDGFNGHQPGPVFFVTESNHSPDSNTTTLTVDTKYRDYLTVSEVRARGRDAMRPLHLLTPGQYSTTVPDRLIHWSYNRSGFVPFKSHKLWHMWSNDDTNNLEMPFPWTDLTTQFPPRTYGHLYMKIAGVPGENPRGTQNDPVSTAPFWSLWEKPGKGKDKEKTKGPHDLSNGFAVLASVGEVSSFKMVCVDKNGQRLPVSYFVGVFPDKTTTAKATPHLPGGRKAADYHTDHRHYKAGEPYPFFPYAWEGVLPDGTKPRDAFYTASVPPFAAYGTSWDRPGYWPGSMQSPNSPRTGQFVDDSGFGFDMTGWNGTDTTYREENTLLDNTACQVLVFCDELPHEDKFFLGRMYRTTPGTS